MPLESPRRVEQNIRTYKSETLLVDPRPRHSRNSVHSQGFYIDEEYELPQDYPAEADQETSKWPSIACADRLVSKICGVGRLPPPSSSGRSPTPDAASSAAPSHWSAGAGAARSGTTTPAAPSSWQEVLSDLATDAWALRCRLAADLQAPAPPETAPLFSTAAALCSLH